MGVHGDYLRGVNRMAGVGALTGALAGAWGPSRGGQRGAQRGQRGLFSMAGGGTPLNMLVSQQKKISCGEYIFIFISLFLDGVGGGGSRIVRQGRGRNETTHVRNHPWIRTGCYAATRVNGSDPHQRVQ